MTRRGWDHPWQSFPASKPLKADNGIATRKQRGAMASTWWSKRFVEVLESYGLGARMQRGRRYARSGQVLDVDVAPGLLVAQVQGSRRTPYVVTARCEQPSEAQWSRLDDTLRAQVRFAAQLLAGEVPPELEAACGDAGIELFPSTWTSLQATCGCPDWENPCKHIAAVLYVFADQLDDDPWLLLAWHGHTRDQVLAYLSGGGQSGPGHRTDGLPAWWPLVPGRAGPSTGRWVDRVASPPQPPDRVLARMERLDADVAGAPAADLLGPAYAALVENGPEPAEQAPAPPLKTQHAPLPRGHQGRRRDVG